MRFIGPISKNLSCLLLAFGLGAPALAAPAGPAWPAAQQGWRPLFNGRDLSNWEVYLGVPPPSVQVADLPRKLDGTYAEPLGVGRDPKRVFSVDRLEGQPVIHVSGEIYGVISTRESYDNFHLQLEYRWGERRWAPRLDLPRDSGILYYAVGPHGVSGSMRTWMRSIECQIQEHDTGDYVGVDGVFVDVTVSRPAEGSLMRFSPGGETVRAPGKGVARRVARAFENERAGWNQVEVMCVAGTCVHVVNGRANMVVRDPRQPGPQPGAVLPLRSGKIQLQSEGAEVFFRGVRVRPLRALPAYVTQPPPAAP